MKIVFMLALLAGLVAMLDARTISANHAVRVDNEVSDDTSDDTSDVSDDDSSDDSHDDSDDVRDGSDVTSTRDHMTMSFVMGKTRVKLDLDKNENVPQLSSYYSVENGKLIQWPLDEEQELSAYVNRTTQDTIVISKQRQNGSVVTGYMGSFHSGGQRYSLMTMDAMKASQFGDRQQQTEARPLPISSVSMVYIGKSMHAIKPVSNDDDAGIIDDAAERAESPERIAGKRKRIITQKRRRENKIAARGKQHYVIDYFVVVDFAIYNRWYSTSTATSHQRRRVEAVRNIRYYYTHVVNGIDLRYSTIQESDFAINVRFVGFLIAMSPDESVWTEGSDFKITWSGESYTDAYKALDALGDYVEDHGDMFESVDHIALFTGNSLYNGGFKRDGSGPSVISGLAGIGSACHGGQRTSVNREFGQYGSIATAAHELGHNVGAFHDGQNNECSTGDQYIMASAPRTLTDSIFNNPFRFSHCSIRSFRQFLRTLDADDTNCLSVTSELPTVTDNSMSPGQQFTPDEQCQQLYGRSSFHCAGGSRDARICGRMECWIAKLKLCFASSEQRAFDKTTCGRNRWCVRGRCVHDRAAPSASDSCVYGDYRGLFDVGQRTMSCAQIGSEAPYKCYETNIAEDCCETCTRIQRTDNSGCEYGDRTPSECERGRRSACYDDAYKSRCCATCSKPQFNSGRAGCEFGDKALFCRTNKPSDCYGNDETCCETCHAWKTGRQGCEYGDRADWCSSYVRGESECLRPDVAAQCCRSCERYIDTNGASNTPSPPSACSDKASWCRGVSAARCYNDDVSNTCCRTCQRLKISQTVGCEYGDKASWCRGYVRGRDECLRSEVAEHCCHTCRSYLDSQPTTTTVGPTCRDNADWCPGLFAGQCYDRSVERVCCATCSRHRTSQQRCRYGDKYTWCRTEFCSTNANDCCATC